MPPVRKAELIVAPPKSKPALAAGEEVVRVVVLVPARGRRGLDRRVVVVDALREEEDVGRVDEGARMGRVDRRRGQGLVAVRERGHRARDPEAGGQVAGGVERHDRGIVGIEQAGTPVAQPLGPRSGIGAPPDEDELAAARDVRRERRREREARHVHDADHDALRLLGLELREGGVHVGREGARAASP